MVLLLLPTSTNKLLAKWQGPYRVARKVGKVNYLIEMPDKLETASSLCGMAKEISEEEFPDWKASTTSAPALGSQLSYSERDEIKEILKKFQDVMQSKPGRTTLTEHTIKTESAQPVRLAPYRIPHAYREAVARELDEMQQSGIIEPSSSE